MLYMVSINTCYSQTTENVTINIQGIDITDTLIKPHMLGVISGPNPIDPNATTPDLTNLLQDVGVTTIRNNDYYDDRLDMEQLFYCGTLPIDSLTPNYPDWNCDPFNPSNYNWTQSDQQFARYQAGNFIPFFRLGNEYNNIPRQHDYNGPRSTEENNWIQAAKTVTSHYDNFGGDPDALGGYLNIWTEWPNPTFWDRTNVEFDSFWQRAYDSLKMAFPNLKIGGPGLHTSITLLQLAQGLPSTQLYDFLNNLKIHNTKPDWIGYHVFSNNIEKYYNVTQNLRHYLDATGPYASLVSDWGGSGINSFFHGVEIICDAWMPSKQDSNGNALTKAAKDSIFNKQRGGAINMGAFIVFQQADVERAYKYRAGEDSNPNANASNGFYNMGGPALFYGDSAGTYKPQGYSFKMCSKMQTEYKIKLISPVFSIASGGTKVWSLAGENTSGEKAIIVSNNSSNTILLNIQLNGIPLSTGDYNFINQYMVTDNNNGQVPLAWSGGSFTLPPYTANLITMKNTLTINDPHINVNEISLYPNPFGQRTTLEITNWQNQNYELKIYDLFGREVRSCKIQNQKTEISRGNLPVGVYFYQVTNKEQTIGNGKLIIK